MPRIRFTARSIDAIKPPTGKVQEDYWDDSLTGFGVRVTSEGKKTWFVKYRHKGRRPRVSFGVYPIMTLADARLEAQKILHAAILGVDTSSVKRAERIAETVRELAEDYLQRHAKLNKKSWREDERMLNREVIPAWGSRRVKDIARRDVIRLLDATVERGAPIQANRLLALVRKLFNFGIQRDVLEFNPCHQVARPAAETSRERVLTEEEIKAIWTALDELGRPMRAILRLYFLTAQRGNEIRAMRWADIDLEAGWWTIPGEQAKNGLSHRVPLNALADGTLRDLLLDRDDPTWVFPSPTASGKHVDHTQKAIQRLRASAGVAFVGHDIRRTVASHMTSMGISRFIVSKLLNHVEPGITKVYDRHSYDREKREALVAWNTKLDGIVRSGAGPSSLTSQPGFSEAACG